jgi:hypothetical protein
MLNVFVKHLGGFSEVQNILKFESTQHMFYKHPTGAEHMSFAQSLRHRVRRGSATVAARLRK